MSFALKDILRKVNVLSSKGNLDVSVNAVNFDSRKIVANDLFIAIRGNAADGHDYIEKVINLGATAIVCEQFPTEILASVCYILVKDTNEALAIIANTLYDNPSQKLKLVGITGTNGKTTVATLLYQLFKNAGYKVGLLSTVKILVHDKEYKATHTTPDSLVINKYLNEMVLAGVQYCFMEVSSHGIHQKRTEGLTFEGGIFTNLSHDHLDYHPTFASYRDVKKSFFDYLPKNAFALINADDKNGAVMLQNSNARKLTYSLKTHGDYKGIILENQLSGLVLKINNNEVYTRLIGDFNAYNLLAIYGAAVELGMDKMEVLRNLSLLESVSGRFQYIISDQQITAIVDYAHTPDALENVLQTINTIRTKTEQVITVIGCGGDRDTSKRPIMAAIATSLSDKVIITSDNPRSENPESIIADMEAGIEDQYLNKTVSITDRKQAIKTACQLANPKDIILIAGKGHENYQEINGVRHHFDDMEVVTEMLSLLKK